LLVCFDVPATIFPKIWKVTSSVCALVSMPALFPMAVEALGWIRLTPTVLLSARAPAVMTAWTFSVSGARTTFGSVYWYS